MFHHEHKNQRIRTITGMLGNIIQFATFVYVVSHHK